MAWPDKQTTEVTDVFFTGTSVCVCVPLHIYNTHVIVLIAELYARHQASVPDGCKVLICFNPDDADLSLELPSSHTHHTPINPVAANIRL